MRTLAHLRRCLKLCWIVAVSLAGDLTVAAQVSLTPASEAGLAVQRWTALDGLPADVVTDLAVDAEGYLWVATFAGLVRFDGMEFELLTSANTPAFPSNRVVALDFDESGAMWILFELGVFVRFADGEFTRFGLAEGIDNPQTRIRFAGGDVWAFGEANLSRLEGDRFGDVALAMSGRVRDVLHRRNGDTCIAQGDAVTCGDFTAPYFAASTWVAALHEDGDERLWVATADQLLRQSDAGSFQAVRRFDGDSQWARIHEPVAGEIWVARFDGWTTYRPGPEFLNAGRALRRTRAVFSRDDGVWWVGSQGVFRDATPILATRGITAMEPDADGTIWIGSEEGLFAIRSPVFDSLAAADGLPGTNIYPIIESRSGLRWVGTWEAGLARWSEESVEAHAIESEGFGPGAISLYEDRLGRIWVGGYHGLCVVADDGPCLPHPEMGGLGGVRAILEDSAGRVWLGAARELWLREGGAWRRLDATGEVPHVWARTMLEAQDGSIYLGFNGGGVARYDGERFAWLNTSNGLSSNVVRDIVQLLDGTIWIATEDRGVCRLQPASAGDSAPGVVECLDASDGLPDDGIHRILADDSGRLWMSTNRGVFWARRDDLDRAMADADHSVTAVAYDETDGLPSSEANGGSQSAGVRLRDGRLAFPTQAGIAIVDPGRVELPETPPVRAVRLSVSGEPRPVPAGAATLQLAPDERDIELVWSAPSLTYASDIAFRYRLEGYDQSWSEPRRERRLSYTNLPPGALTLRVIAGLGGEWSDPGLVLNIYRRPLFVETPWFPAGLATVAVLVVATGLGFRARRLKQRQVELEATIDETTAELRERNKIISAQAARLGAVDELKSRFVANVSHELRTPLTLIAGPLADLEEEVRDPDMRRRIGVMLRNTERLRGLVDQLLDAQHLELGDLPLLARLREVPRFVEEIAARFEPQASGRALTVRRPSTGIAAYLDADKIEKVISNLLSNALKFSPDRTAIEISVEVVGHGDAVPAVRVAIADEGPGIAESEHAHLFERFYQVEASDDRTYEGAGIGLALAQELVELHGGDIGVESAPGEGSTFWFTLPLGPDHLSPDQIEMAAATDDVAPAPDPAGDQVEDPSRRTVLLVEDHTEMLAYLATHFGRSYRTLTAANGREALRVLSDESVDVLVSDVMMPELDGLALCRRVRADSRLGDLPIVLVTANAGAASRADGLELANDYVVKPFRMPDLLARVAMLAAGVTHSAAAEQSAQDRAACERLRKAIAAGLHAADFGVAHLARSLALSERQLFRTTQSLLGRTPAELVREARMLEAQRLLREGLGPAEVAARVGLSRSYFSRAYAAWYGHPPSAEK
ncbi:MAG: response regulator [Acidobacteria bacterium]|nr:response regulator [Acidobacteriota bacterium]